MGTWNNNWFIGICVVSLLFFVIPIKINGPVDEKLITMFDEYVQRYNKTYSRDPKTYEEKYNNFKQSVAEIEQLNAAIDNNKEHSAKYGLTIFSDMSKDEFAEIHLSDEKPTRHNSSSHSKHRSRHHPNSVIESSEQTEVHRIERSMFASLPQKVDWREKNVIGDIQNQGTCGACWAFSTIATIETMAAIHTGKFQPFSVQEMIDCAQNGNLGCLGGDICALLEWLTDKSVVIAQAARYPLADTATFCKVQAPAVNGVKVSAYECNAKIGSEETIVSALATHGPVTVAVNALSWQHYLGGVIQYHCSGNHLDLNHAVQLVGYDLTVDTPYYIARNSWGEDFGDNGYLKLAIGKNICGLANEVAIMDVDVI